MRPEKKSEAKLMEEIRQLMAIAASTNHDGERETALARANRLMAKHAIDQAMLDASRTTFEKRKPVVVTFKMFDRDDASSYVAQLRTVLDEICRTNRVRCALHYNTDSATLVGMQEDVDWVQMLWMNTLMTFVSAINPRWNPEDTLGANILRFKEAGQSWESIWYQAKKYGQNLDDMQRYANGGAPWMIREYRKEAKRQGRPMVATQRHVAYRASYTAAFVLKVQVRLENMREVSRQEEVAVPGAELALRDMSQEVDEIFYARFPSMRPLTEEEWALRRQAQEAMEREEERKDQEFLASLSPAERRKVLEAREREERRKARESETYYRQQQRRRQKLYDGAGWVAGETAADEVKLSRSGPAAGSSSEREALEA